MSMKGVRFPFGKCRVCHDKATGFHYGLITCEGCKVFFRRNAIRHTRGRCFKGGNCEITPENRTQCKACRFTVCLQLGMSLQAVRKMGRIPINKKQRALHAEAVIKEKSSNVNIWQFWNPSNSQNTTTDLYQTFSDHIKTKQTNTFTSYSSQSDSIGIDFLDKDFSKRETFASCSSFKPIKTTFDEGCVSEEMTTIRCDNEPYSFGIFGNRSTSDNRGMNTVLATNRLNPMNEDVKTGGDSKLNAAESCPVSLEVLATTKDRDNGVTDTKIESIKVIAYKVKKEKVQFRDYELDVTNLDGENIKNNRDDQYEIHGHLSLHQNTIYERKSSQELIELEAVSDTKELTLNGRSIIQVKSAFRQSPEMTFSQYLHDVNIGSPSYYGDGFQGYNTKSQYILDICHPESKFDGYSDISRTYNMDKQQWDTGSWRIGAGNPSGSEVPCNLPNPNTNSHTTFSLPIGPGQPTYRRETHSFPKTSVDFVISRPRATDTYLDEQDFRCPRDPSKTFQTMESLGNQNLLIPDARVYETRQHSVSVKDKGISEPNNKSEIYKTEINYKTDEVFAVYAGSSHDSSMQKEHDSPCKQEYRKNERNSFTVECLTGTQRKGSYGNGEMSDWLHEFNFLQSISQTTPVSNAFISASRYNNNSAM